MFVSPVTRLNGLQGFLSNGFDDVPRSYSSVVFSLLLVPWSIYSIYLTGYFPYIPKTAKIQPIFKKGDEQDMKNYRPISILKVFPKYWRNLCLKSLIPL